MRQVIWSLCNFVEKYFRHPQITAIVIFASASFLIVLPLLVRPGIIFLLDLSPIPNISFPWNTMSNAFLYDFLWWFLNLFLPTGILQKLSLFLALFLAGFGMFRLFSKLQGSSPHIQWGAYFAGIFYLLNPVVYSRILVGQWIFVFSYALLPWLITSFLEFSKNIRLRQAFIVSIWLTSISIINLHVGIMASFLILVLGLGFFITMWYTSRRFPGTLVRGYVFIVISFVILNFYWLFPLVRGISPVAQLAQTVINDVHILSFFTRPDNQHGIFWNVAALYGFWGDGSGYYHSQKIFTPYWFYVFLFIGICVLWGIIISFTKKSPLQDGILGTRERAFSISLLLVGCISFWLIVGVSFSPIKDEMLWIYRHFTLMRAFREPQKFAMLLAFIYSIFGGIGIQNFIGRTESIRNKKLEWIRVILPGILVLIPLLYSPGLFWRFRGQIDPGEYPQSWFQVNEFLNKDPESFQVLFLPWHQYLYLSFAKTVIFNPAQLFFDKPIIAGDNIEFGPIYTQSTQEESHYIFEEILSKQKTLTNMGEKLISLKVKYVIFALEADFFNYSFVERQKDLKLILEKDNLRVFLNLAWEKKAQNENTQ